MPQDSDDDTGARGKRRRKPTKLTEDLSGLSGSEGVKSRESSFDSASDASNFVPQDSGSEDGAAEPVIRGRGSKGVVQQPVQPAIQQSPAQQRAPHPSQYPPQRQQQPTRQDAAQYHQQQMQQQQIQQMQLARQQQLQAAQMQAQIQHQQRATMAAREQTEKMRNDLAKHKINQVLALTAEMLTIWNSQIASGPPDETFVQALSARVGGLFGWITQIQNAADGVAARAASMQRVHLDFPPELRPELTGHLIQSYAQLKNYFDAAETHERDLQAKAITAAEQQSGKPSVMPLMLPPASRQSSVNSIHLQHQQLQQQQQQRAGSVQRQASITDSPPKNVKRERESSTNQTFDLSASLSQSMSPIVKKQRLDESQSSSHGDQSFGRYQSEGASQAIAPPQQMDTMPQNSPQNMLMRPPSRTTSMTMQPQMMDQAQPQIPAQLMPMYQQIQGLSQQFAALQQQMQHPQFQALPQPQKQPYQLQLQSLKQQHENATIRYRQAQMVIAQSQLQQQQQPGNSYLQGQNGQSMPPQRNPFVPHQARTWPADQQGSQAGSPPYNAGSPAYQTPTMPAIGLQSSRSIPDIARPPSVAGSDHYSQAGQYRSMGQPAPMMAPSQQQAMHMQRLGMQAGQMSQYSQQSPVNPLQQSPYPNSNDPPMRPLSSHQQFSSGDNRQRAPSVPAPQSMPLSPQQLAQLQRMQQNQNQQMQAMSQMLQLQNTQQAQPAQQIPQGGENLVQQQQQQQLPSDVNWEDFLT